MPELGRVYCSGKWVKVETLSKYSGGARIVRMLGSCCRDHKSGHRLIVGKEMWEPWDEEPLPPPVPMYLRNQLPNL
jgi:hypothetical protein